MRTYRTISATLVLALASATFLITPASATPKGSSDPNSVTGELIRTISEAPRDSSGEPIPGGATVHTFVDTGAESVTLQDPQGLLHDVLSGSEISVAATTEAFTLTSGESSSVVELNAVSPTATTTATGNHKFYVALPTRSGAKSYLPPSASAAKTLVSQASDYWASQTFGKVSGFSVAKIKGYTTKLTRSTVCNIADPSDANQVWQEAAKQTGFTRGARKHLIVFTEPCADEVPVGVAEIGAGLDSGGYITVNDASLPTLVHEIGHNFSLGHSNLDVFDHGEVFEYEGYHSPMSASLPDSWGTVPALDVAYQHRLQVLPTGQLRTLIGSQTVKLAPVDGTSGRRGALFYLPTTGKRVYLEYRAGTAFDFSAMFKSQQLKDMYDSVRFGAGVRVYTIELDDLMTLNDLGTYTWHGKYPFFQTTLLQGESLDFPSAGFTIDVTNASSTFADVKVSLAKAASRVSASSTSATYGSTPRIKVTTSSKSYLGGTVTAYYNGKVMGTAEVPTKRGTQTVSLPLRNSLPMGSHTVTLKYSGSVSAKSSTASTTVSIVKATPSVKVKVSNAYRLHAPKAQVTVSSTKLPAGSVTAWVDGKKVATKSLENGSTTFTLPTYSKSGTHTLKVKYSGSSRFEAVTKSTSFAAIKKRGKVTGFNTGTQSVESGKSYSDTFTVNHAATLQKRVSGEWIKVRSLAAGTHASTVKTPENAGKYRVLIKTSTSVVGIATESVTIKFR